MATETVTEGPPPELRYRSQINLFASAREAWNRRELVLTLVERELRVRYKQTRLGFAWSVIVPVMLMIVFTIFVDRVVNIDTKGVPYPVFVYVGLIPWTFFSVSVNQGGQSIVNNASLLNKVRCPRELFPIASVGVSGVDAFISTGVLCIIFLITGFAPKGTSVWIPILMVMQIAFTWGVSLLISGVMVYLRDLRQAMPLLLQLGLFATPVAYPVNLSPSFERIYAVINPLAPIIDGYRRAVLFGDPPAWGLLGLSSITITVLLFGGYLLFKHLETGFADVA